MDYIIETNDLCKTFNGKQVLKNVNMHVKKGEIYGFVGENGAGKTTTMKIILGLLGASSGKVIINTNNSLDNARKKIGSLIESPGLYLNKTAKENMRLFTYLFEGDVNEIDKILDKVGLLNAGNKKVGQFSLGMKQRLGLAVSLIGNPDILILDEPINGLDPKGIMDMRNLFLELKNEGKTLIISSHIITELQKIADTFGIINKGEIIKEVESGAILDNTPYCNFEVSDTTSAIKVLETLKLLPKYEVKENVLKLHYPFDKQNVIKALVNNNILIKTIVDEKEDVELYLVKKMEEKR